jgi:hypothetical protein
VLTQLDRFRRPVRRLAADIVMTSVEIVRKKDGQRGFQPLPKRLPGTSVKDIVS